MEMVQIGNQLILLNNKEDRGTRWLLEGLSGVHFSVILKVLINCCLLVLLVLGDQVVHVRLGLGELHLVHALPGVPVKESFSSEQGRELLGDSLENFLDGGGVSDEG